MSPGLPLRKGGELLRDGVEQANDDTNWRRLHVGAELVDGSGVWYTIVAVELHLLPYREKDGGKHEDCWPVL